MALRDIQGSDTPNEGKDKINTNNTRIRRLVDAVAGGSGFENVSGSVTLDLDETSSGGGRVFHHTMTGNISSVSFANIPNSSEFETEWVWVLRIDATGGYTLSGTPSVDWRDKSDGFNNLDLTANGENMMFFRRVGSSTHAWLIDTGTVGLDSYKLSFAGDGTQYVYIDQGESVDLANAATRTSDGSGSADGTLSFNKNDASASGVTAFVDGDVLTVTRSGSSEAAAVVVPRSLS